MSILELWGFHSSGFIVSLNLCQIVCGLIGACAVNFALVKWRTELYKPELSQGIGNALEQFKGERHGRRIERLVLGLLRARRLYLDPRFLASAWGFVITSFTFAFLIFTAAIFNVIWHILIEHDTCLSPMEGFQCITMFLATAALVSAASFEFFNIRQGRVYPRTLNRRWCRISAIAGSKWTGEAGEALYKALEELPAANRRWQKWPESSI
jgi:hypothetical protein